MGQTRAVHGSTARLGRRLTGACPASRTELLPPHRFKLPQTETQRETGAVTPAGNVLVHVKRQRAAGLRAERTAIPAPCDAERTRSHGRSIAGLPLSQPACTRGAPRKALRPVRGCAAPAAAARVTAPSGAPRAAGSGSGPAVCPSVSVRVRLCLRSPTRGRSQRGRFPPLLRSPPPSPHRIHFSKKVKTEPQQTQSRSKKSPPPSPSAPHNPWASLIPAERPDGPGPLSLLILF